MVNCSKCNKRPRLKWHASYCNECYNERDRARYYRNRKNRLEKDRKYYQKNKAKYILKTEKARKKFPERFKARQDLRNAIARGDIKRLVCEVCKEKKTHAHHTDYSKPFDVKWLCIKHHYEQHRKYKNTIMGR